MAAKKKAAAGHRHTWKFDKKSKTWKCDCGVDTAKVRAAMKKAAKKAK